MSTKLALDLQFVVAENLRMNQTPRLLLPSKHWKRVCRALQFYGYSLVTFPILQQVVQHADFSAQIHSLKNGGQQCTGEMEWSGRKCGRFASIQTRLKVPQFLALLPQTRNVSPFWPRMNANCMASYKIGRFLFCLAKQFLFKDSIVSLIIIV